MMLVLLFLLNTVSCTKGKVMPVVDAKVDANYVIQASWSVGEPKQCYTAPSAVLDGQPMLLCGGVWGAWFIFHDPKLVNTAQSQSVSEAITKSAHYFPVQLGKESTNTYNIGGQTFTIWHCIKQPNGAIDCDAAK